MDKGYIKTGKPTTPFPTDTNVLKTKNDEFWKNWIFYYLLYFYKNSFKKNELCKIIETARKNNNKQIEKIIAKFLRRSLKNNDDFDYNCGFKIKGESTNDEDIEGFLDIIILHSYWNKEFIFECKNLNETQDSVNKYVYKNTVNQVFDGGVYRYFNGKYAQSQDFGGMIGFVLEGNLFTIKNKILDKLQKTKFDTSPDGDLIRIIDNSIEQNDFTFDSYHNRENRKNKEFVIHHLLFDICL